MPPTCRCRNIRARKPPGSISLRPCRPTRRSFSGPARYALVPTGIAIALPPGSEGQVRPRSGLAAKHGVTVLNAPGTIDSDYRGEIGVVLINHGTESFSVTRGMRIAQLVIAPIVQAHVRVVEKLDQTARGQGGFGSTGVKNEGFRSKS